jgi:type IV pilus assembly protein PilM
MYSNTFGLDLGTTTIRAIWLEKEGHLLRYKASFSAPAPMPGIQSESSFDHQELAKYLNKLVLDAKITTKEVVIALPESQVFTKVIDMPVLSEKEISSAIYWEAEQYIPAKIDTMTLDWTVLRRPRDVTSQEKMQVLLVGAPMNLIKRYQAVLEAAGLSLVAVETEILSLIRGVVPSNRFPTSLLVNIGALSTSFCIVQNGVLLFNYTVPLGGISMTRAIAADFGFSPLQAEEYKRTYGISDKNFGGKVGAAIQPILTELLSELRKAIIFYNEKYHNDAVISQILLTGGGATLPGVDLYFAQQLGIETVIANPWKQHGILGVPPAIQVHGAEYSVVVGLALKEYEAK